jgi:hypothetical protein
MKTKLTIIDTAAVYNSVDYNDPKTIKALKKDRDYATTLVNKTIAKIKFGAVKSGRFWFTVVNGEIVQDGGYQHSTQAIYFATRAANQAGYTVKEV